MSFGNRYPHSRPTSSEQVPTQASHSGRRICASAGAAAGAILVIPLDPTGTAFGTAVGFSADAVRLAIQKIVTKHRAKKALATTNQTSSNSSSSSQDLVLGHPQADAMLTTDTGDLQIELESCIRQLSSSVTGVAVTGTMTLILPAFLLGLGLSSAELIFQARRLRHLTAQAHAAGGVSRYISRSAISAQVLSGIFIKSAILICTLGADVDIVIHGFAQLVVNAEVVADPALVPATWQQAGHVTQLYDSAIGHGFLQNTTLVAAQPANLVAGSLGYQQMPTWDNGASGVAVAEIGAANVLVDLVTGRLVEEPAHELLDVASRLGRRFGGGGAGAR